MTPLSSSPHQRKKIAYAWLEILHKAKQPTVLVGNAGYALASLLWFVLDYRRDHGVDLEAMADVLISPDQELICLYRKAHGHHVVRIDVAASTRLLVLELISDADATTQDVPEAETNGIANGPVESSAHEPLEL